MYKKKQLETMQAQLLAAKQKEADKQASLQASRGEVANLKSQVASSNAELEKEID